VSPCLLSTAARAGSVFSASALSWNPTPPPIRASPLERLCNFLVASLSEPSLEARLHGRKLARPVGALKIACEQSIDGRLTAPSWLQCRLVGRTRVYFSTSLTVKCLEAII
jgi:hypothetical protein